MTNIDKLIRLTTIQNGIQLVQLGLLVDIARRAKLVDEGIAAVAASGIETLATEFEKVAQA